MNETVQVTGRTKRPLLLKLFIPWWFYNSEDPTPPHDYLPDRNFLWRFICWYCRNPLHNFGAFVAGVCDKNYSVTGPRPVETPTWEDVAQNAPGRYPDAPLWGWKWSVIHRTIPLPFISYCSTSLLAYAGWQPYGFFGFKLNVR